MTIMVSFCILRNLKDSLIQSHVGTETMPYMKTFIMLPTSFLVTLIVIKLFNLFNRKQVFHLMAIIFMLFLLCFSIFIYPNLESFLLPKSYIAHLTEKYHSIHHFIKLMEYWPITIFYAVSELWMLLLGNTLFWQLINDMTTTTSAEKLYPIYALFGHSGALLGTFIIKGVNIVHSQFETHSPSIYVLTLIIFVIFFGIAMIKLFDKIDNQTTDSHIQHTQKEELSFVQSIKYILKSKYLLFIFLIILSFVIQTNLFDLLRKKHVEIYYLSDTLAISDYHAMFFGAVAIVTIVLTLIFRVMINKFGWFTTSIIPPMVLLVIFTPYCLKVFGIDIINYNVVHPTLAILLILSIQQLLNRAVRYGAIQPTKEMLYVPLERNLRSKGKAAVEILAPTIAKSIGGAFIIIMLTFSDISSIENLQEECVIICGLCLCLWIYSICKINKMYLEKVQQ